MSSNTEPIPVGLALRLCEMAIEDCDKATPGDLEAAPRWVLLARAVMRPMLEGVQEQLERLAGYGETEVPDISAAKTIAAAMRAHYDKTRPNWRSQ